MVDTITWIIVGSTVTIILAFALRYLRRRDTTVQEPIIELEPLTNCGACGSLIPEGVKRCAFCGAEQKATVNNREEGSTNN